MSNIRFTGQIVRHAQTGRKGQIVRIIRTQPVSPGLEDHDLKNINVSQPISPRAYFAQLIIMWEKNIEPEYCPALSEDIQPLINTNSPFYPLLNYWERVKFVPVVFDLYQRKKRSDRS